MVAELPGFCILGVAGCAGWRSTSFRAKQKSEMRDALWLRRWFGCGRHHLEPVVSYHQAVVDQFLRAGRRRDQLLVDGDLLSSDRRAWLQEMGVSVYSDRNERLGRVYRNRAVRFSENWRHLRRRSVAARRTVGRSAIGYRRINRHLVDPVLDVSHANICEVMNRCIGVFVRGAVHAS